MTTDYGTHGPGCGLCAAAYPDEADHESCAEVTISRESAPWIRPLHEYERRARRDK